MTITLQQCNNDNPDFRVLVGLLDGDLNSRYGELQNQYTEFNQVEFLDLILVAFQDKNPVGCGCYKKYDQQTVEIKRMFLKTEFRGSGIAQQIITELETLAVNNGYKKVVLETGIKQVEAIRFYQRLGYLPIENYGQYIGNPNSICMAKNLS